MPHNILLLVLFSLITTPLFASGNIKAGEQKSIVCAACHGTKGISTNPMWPNLAGQHAVYTLKQLKDFKIGKHRNDPSMTGMVANLSEQDMQDLAAFYANLPINEGHAKKKDLLLGEKLYRAGDFKDKVTACIACHGPQGLGNAQAGFPVISGQHSQYAVQQLMNFKQGKRTNDLNSIMQDISHRMSQKQMQTVANYLSGLH
jgi:cytochrome c553